MSQAASTQPRTPGSVPPPPPQRNPQPGPQHGQRAPTPQPAPPPPPPQATVTAVTPQAATSAALQRLENAYDTNRPITRAYALTMQHSKTAVEGPHRQVAATSVDDATLDQCFQINPKLHYIKSNAEETVKWLDTASFEAILLELLCFALDQGHIHKEVEGQFEKELEKAVENIERLDCFEAFCSTFLKDGRFRPTGHVKLTGSAHTQKYDSLFRMINTDLQNLTRQQRVLSMVCPGTADHEVHTLAHRDNLRRLVEDLVHIVYPGDRGTYSEVYKTIAENSVYDQRHGQQLTSLKIVARPDIVMPFGGPLLAGGQQVKCDALERKIRCKLPGLVIKMHFSDKSFEDRIKLKSVDDSGIGLSLDGDSLLPGLATPGADTGTPGRGKGKDGKDRGSGGGSSGGGDSRSSSGGSRSGSKRKQTDADAGVPKSKRHREELQPHTSVDGHVINELYGEHVAQLLCALTQAPMGYVKHHKYLVSAQDERDGTACASMLGMIVSGEEVYLTKLDASHDFLDSLVETFRADSLNFSCLAIPLNLYKGTHLKALLMFLRYTCMNFPRTTYFLSE